MTSMPDTAPVDGRLARSRRTRRAIVDAMRSLHHDGELRPTAPRVAQRAGVSVRTVWQHFADLETLLVEAGRRDLEIAARFVEPIPPTLPLTERIERLTAQRARMFEAMAPPWRAARLHEPFSAQVRSDRDRLVSLGRHQLARTFGPELRRCPAGTREVLLNAAQAACSWATWEGLRADQHVDPRQARAVVAALLAGLLHPADPRPAKQGSPDPGSK